MGRGRWIQCLICHTGCKKVIDPKPQALTKPGRWTLLIDGGGAVMMGFCCVAYGRGVLVSLFCLLEVWTLQAGLFGDDD